MDTPRRQRDPEKTRQRIFDSARSLFALRGYSGVTIHDIATKAGVNRRMVYVYFGNKKSLYSAVADHAFSVIWGRALSALSSIDYREDPAAAFFALVSAYFDALEAHPEYIRLLGWEAAAGWEHLNATESPFFHSVTQRAGAIVETGIAQGVFWKTPLTNLLSTMPFFYFMFLPRHEHLFGPIIPGKGKEYLMQMIKHALIKPDAPVRPAAPAPNGDAADTEAVLIF